MKILHTFDSCRCLSDLITSPTLEEKKILKTRVYSANNLVFTIDLGFVVPFLNSYIYTYYIIFFFFFFFFCFLGLHTHMWRFPARGRIRATAAGLHHSSRQRQILINPLNDARDRTHNLMVPSRIHFLYTTRELLNSL